MPALTSSARAVFVNRRIVRARRARGSMQSVRAFFGGGDKAATSSKSAHDFTVKSIDGEDVPLSKYAGKVMLVVNVASQ
jgi:glutathione peroxidase|tara:strand:- start:2541 stop:2777 length:237 start_codon:yes stop_codon:yes gene_type:complete